MASNNRRRFIEILRLLDSTEIIKENKRLVKPSEKLINNPVELSRLIMRRRLKEAFPIFSIRKNQDQYALRCDNDDLYQVLFLASSINGNSNFANSMQTEYKRGVLAKLEGAFTALQTMRDSREGINYNFKADNKLFIYVSFIPLYGINQPLTACERFNSISLKSRISKMDIIAEAINKIKMDSSLEDLLLIIKRETVYSIYNSNVELTEDFVTFYANSLRGEEYIPIKTALRIFKRRQLDEVAKQAILKGQQEEVSKLLDTLKESSETQMPGIRLIERSTDILPDIDTDVLVNPFEEETVETLTTVPVPASDFSQADFERALRALRGGNQSQAEQAITISDISILRPIEPKELEELAKTEKITNRDEEYSDVLNNNIYGSDFLLYSHHINTNDNRPTNMKYTDIDIYDDLDIEKDGLYFTIKDGIINHQVIVKNEIIFETTEKQLAEDKFKEVFGIRPKEIKFYME